MAFFRRCLPLFFRSPHTSHYPEGRERKAELSFCCQWHCIDSRCGVRGRPQVCLFACEWLPPPSLNVPNFMPLHSQKRSLPPSAPPWSDLCLQFVANKTFFSLEPETFWRWVRRRESTAWTSSSTRLSEYSKCAILSRLIKSTGIKEVCVTDSYNCSASAVT